MRLPRYPVMTFLVVGFPCVGCSPHEGDSTVEQTSSALEQEVESTLEEDFDYPGAEGYRASGIVLKKGDGNLLLVDCATEAHVLEVESNAGPDNFCFQIRGQRAFVTLELPRVFLISTTNPAVVARVSENGKVRTAALEQGYNGFVNATLLELRLTP